jgi:anti-sigma regulatory factor (Ser/Thr protein kinase)
VESVTTPSDDIDWYHVGDRPGDATIRRASMALASRLGFDENRAGEVGIVAAEMTANIARHAGGGAIAVWRLPGAGVGLLAVDRGPGMADMAGSAADGHSTKGTLGIGLGAVSRLSTTVDSYSIVGRGTVTAASIWADREFHGDPEVGLLTRAMTNEVMCGDTCTSGRDDNHRIVAVADGLGHGPLAAAASREAVRVLAESPSLSPAEALTLMHARIHHTRGAAVAVAEIDLKGHQLTFSSIGNVAGWIVDDGKRKGMVSYPGIVGHNLRTVREERYEFRPGAILVIHSDGLTDKWNLADYPGLMVRSPLIIAAVLMRDAGLRHDDASVAVAKMAP